MLVAAFAAMTVPMIVPMTVATDLFTNSTFKCTPTCLCINTKSEAMHATCARTHARAHRHGELIVGRLWTGSAAAFSREQGTGRKAKEPVALPTPIRSWHRR